MAANQRITRFQESAENAYEAAGNRVTEAYEGTEQMIRQHPTTSLVVTFGIGFGLGLAATALLMPSPRRRTWAERNLPDWATRERLNELLSRVPEKVSSARHSWW